MLREKPEREKPKHRYLKAEKGRAESEYPTKQNQIMKAMKANSSSFQ
jgi:hypothetical protein